MDKLEELVSSHIKSVMGELMEHLRKTGCLTARGELEMENMKNVDKILNKRLSSREKVELLADSLGLEHSKEMIESELRQLVREEKKRRTAERVVSKRLAVQKEKLRAKYNELHLAFDEMKSLCELKDELKREKREKRETGKV